MFSASGTSRSPSVTPANVPGCRVRADSLRAQASDILPPSGWTGETTIFPAIASAFDCVGELALIRGNRPGWSGPDGDEWDVVTSRENVQESLTAECAWEKSPAEFQMAMARGFWSEYGGSSERTAYCTENAALCFGQLHNADIELDHMRIIAFSDRTPGHAKDHVAILYSEELPQLSSNEALSAANSGGRLEAGITIDQLESFLSSNAGTSLIVDPWAEKKLCFFCDAPDKDAIHNRLMTHLATCNVPDPIKVKSYGHW